MKRILLVIISFQILGLFSLSAECMKLPALWEHYQVHRHSTTPGISFMAFLKLHYTLGSSEHANAEHQKLPLKSHNETECIGHSHIGFPPHEFTYHFMGALLNTELVIAGEKCLLPKPYLSGVFQPPKA